MWGKILAKLGICSWDVFGRSTAHLPCYINRATVTNKIAKIQDIRDFIEGCKEFKKDQISVLLFSVTEDDEHYKKWLKVAEEEGHVVIEGASIHGDYKCWSIIVKNDKFQGMAYYR
jgi:hypothetical protein